MQLGANGRYRTNVLEIAGANTFRAGRDEELARHPTPKPVPLIADLIRDASNINDWVLDCFVGRRHGLHRSREDPPPCSRNRDRSAVCDLAIERWQKFTGKSAILVETGQTFAEVAAERLGESALMTGRRRRRCHERAQEDYKIGYKRPPAAHRFKPGQSGNPAGRPKGRKKFATLLQEIVNRKVSIAGSTKKITMGEAVLRKIFGVGRLGGRQSARDGARAHGKLSRRQP